MDLEIYATGLSSPVFCVCSSTAPTPYDHASANTMVFSSGSNSVKTRLFVRSSLALLNACSCGFPHAWVFLFMSSSLSGCVTSVRFGANLLIWLAIPKNRLTSVTLVGCPNFSMASTSLGSGRIPELSIT